MISQKSARSKSHCHDADVTLNVTDITCSRKHCYEALKLLNKLIPGFEQKANAADNINSFCSPVCYYSWQPIMMT